MRGQNSPNRRFLLFCSIIITLTSSLLGYGHVSALLSEEYLSSPRVVLEGNYAKDNFVLDLFNNKDFAASALACNGVDLPRVDDTPEVVFSGIARPPSLLLCFKFKS